MAPINVLDFKRAGLKGGGHIELLYGGVDEGGMDGLVMVVDGRRLLWLVLGWAGLTQAAFRLFWITMGIVPGCPWKNKWAKQKKKKKKKKLDSHCAPGLGFRYLEKR